MYQSEQFCLSQFTSEEKEFLLPRDKSLTHRAIIFSALAKGTSSIYYPLLGEDCLSTLKIFAQLGVSYGIDSKKEMVTLRSEGIFSFSRYSHPHDIQTLDCGNSGTTARLLLGLFSAIPGFKGLLTGDSSLCQRPMGRVIELIKEQNDQFDFKDRFPLNVTGYSSIPRSYIYKKPSAQVKSAVLFKAMCTDGVTSIELPKGGRDHTEKLLEFLGADIYVETHKNKEKITLKGPYFPDVGKYYIPVDPSSAAFIAVFSLLKPKGTIQLDQVLENPTRTGFTGVIKRMSKGLQILSSDSLEEGKFIEEVCKLKISGGFALKGTTIVKDEIPSLIDEIPILAVLACFSVGTTQFKGVEELRVKESNRLEKIVELISLCGGKAKEDGDNLIIVGKKNFKPQPFVFDCEMDHRLAMSAAVLAKFCESPCTIEGFNAVNTSFPNFKKILAEAM